MIDHKATSTTELPPAVEALVASAHRTQQKLVLVTGVFDIVHREHVAFLQKAKAVGSVLLVGVESDLRAREIKGPGRPVNDELSRWQTLTDLHIADEVFILPNEFSKPHEFTSFIHHIRPQILAVSSHTAHLEYKQKLMEEVGGTVQVVHQHDPSISTTQILAEQAAKKA